MDHVTLTLGRSDTIRENYEIPDDQPEVVHLGPFEYVELTYDLLRHGPDGTFIGGFRDGVWWLNDNLYPFSDLDIYAGDPK